MGKWERLEMVTANSTEWQEVGVCDQGDVGKSETDRQPAQVNGGGGRPPNPLFICFLSERRLQEPPAKPLRVSSNSGTHNGYL